MKTSLCSKMTTPRSLFKANEPKFGVVQLQVKTELVESLSIFLIIHLLACMITSRNSLPVLKWMTRQTLPWQAIGSLTELSQESVMNPELLIPVLTLLSLFSQNLRIVGKKKGTKRLELEYRAHYPKNSNFGY